MSLIGCRVICRGRKEVERQGVDVLTGGPGGPFGPRSPWKAGGKAGQWVSGGCWGPSGSGTGQMVRGCDQPPGPWDAGPPPSAVPRALGPTPSPHPRPFPPLGRGLRAPSKNPPEPLGQGQGLEVVTYVDAVDARDSRGTRRPRRTLLTWGAPLTKEHTRVRGARGASTKRWARARRLPAKTVPRGGRVQTRRNTRGPDVQGNAVASPPRGSERGRQ